jgi:hypothetical protein
MHVCVCASVCCVCVCVCVPAQHFFSSFSNVLDLVGFVTCVLSIYILSLGCTEAEKVSDLVLVLLRTGIQGVRLLLIVRRYIRSIAIHAVSHTERASQCVCIGACVSVCLSVSGLSMLSAPVWLAPHRSVWGGGRNRESLARASSRVDFSSASGGRHDGDGEDDDVGGDALHAMMHVAHTATPMDPSGRLGGAAKQDDEDGEGVGGERHGLGHASPYLGARLLSGSGPRSAPPIHL